ncbi:MAG: M20/M25/M40 family metallo-hydrolase [Microgenomates group bacterium]
MTIQNILEDLIAVPSITGDGVSCRKIIKMAREILRSEHVPSKAIKVANLSILIWGELDLHKTEWLINSHLDVVPGEKSQFNATIVGDKLFGRGSADTKSSCAIMLSNTHHWSQIALEKNITFMLGVDEEIGGASTKEILDQLQKLEGAIFLEPSGEKMIVQAKGIMQIKITAIGKSCHGSRPWEGNSALELLTSGLSSFRLQHKVPRIETRDTTFNFSQLASGIAINQIPGEGTLWCDVRWNPQDDPKQIISNFEKIFVNCTVEVVKLESPVNCQRGSKLRESFVKSLKENGINPISGFDHGSSDARHCTALGIPAIVFGPRGKNLHALNEWVSLKSLVKVEKVLDHWIKNI